MGFRGVAVAAAVLVVLGAALLVAAASARASSAPSGQIALVRDSDIWTINADGTNERRLTNSDESEGNPSWSPDGSAIAYIRGEGSQSQIWRMNADGTDARRVRFMLNAQTMPGTNQHGTVREINDVAWSPSGADITVCAWAATSDIPGGIFSNQLFLVHPDGTHQRRIGPRIQGIYGGISELSWRPDGAQLLLSEVARQGGGSAVIYHLGSNKMSVPFPGKYGGRTMWNAVWSPDGKDIAAGVPDGSSGWFGETHVAVIDMQTRDERGLRISGQVSSGGTQTTWSPDGKWLACSYWRYDDDNCTYLLSTNGTNTRLLMANAAEPAWRPTASPPMSTPAVTLALSGLTDGAVKLRQVVTASGGVRPLTLSGSRVVRNAQLRKRSAAELCRERPLERGRLPGRQLAALGAHDRPRSGRSGGLEREGESPCMLSTRRVR